MKMFDLIELQRAARTISKPDELFKLWEDVCRYYDRGLIGRYELDEMKSVIWPNMRVLTALQNEIESSFVEKRAAA